MGTLKNDIDQLVADAALIHSWTGGDQNTTVSLNGIQVRSPAKLINDFSNWLATNIQNLGTVNTANVFFTGGAISGLSSLSTVGNIGIGTAPSGSWAIQYSVIQAQDGSAFSSYLAGGVDPTPQISSNALGASAGWQYINARHSALYQQNRGAHIFFSDVGAVPAAGAVIPYVATVTFDQTGNFLVGVGSSPDCHRIFKNVAAGSLILRLLGGDANNAGTHHGFFEADNSVWNSAACAYAVGSNSTTTRSINASGTINASGADYAEYETKNATCGTVSKGQIIGFDSSGLITDKFSESISFGIKSTAPNLVGGDAWGTAPALNLAYPVAPVEPLAPVALVVPVQPVAPAAVQDTGTPPTPITSTYMNSWYAYQEYIEQLSVYNAAEAQYQTELSAYNAALPQYQADLSAFQTALTAFQAAETQYQTDLANFNAALETARQKVDRIAYCGKVPVNVTGAAAGDYIIAAAGANDAIIGQIVTAAAITFQQYQNAVGRVRKILSDGRAEVAVMMG